MMRSFCFVTFPLQVRHTPANLHSASDSSLFTCCVQVSTLTYDKKTEDRLPLALPNEFRSRITGRQVVALDRSGYGFFGKKNLWRVFKSRGRHCDQYPRFAPGLSREDRGNQEISARGGSTKRHLHSHREGLGPNPCSI